MLKKLVTVSTAALLAAGGAVGYTTGVFDGEAPQAQANVQVQPRQPKVGEPVAPQAEAYDFQNIGEGSTQGRITTNGGGANVRSGPSTDSGVVDFLPNGTEIQILCQVEGGYVDGYWGPTTIWNKIGEDRWVTDGLVYTGSDGFVADRCGEGVAGGKPPAVQ